MIFQLIPIVFAPAVFHEKKIKYNDEGDIILDWSKPLPTPFETYCLITASVNETKPWLLKRVSKEYSYQIEATKNGNTKIYINDGVEEICNAWNKQEEDRLIQLHGARSAIGSLREELPKDLMN